MGHDTYIEGSLRTFLSELGAPGPEPAGGAALALAGASAAALVSLACHSVPPAPPESPEARIPSSCREEAERLCVELQGLIDSDVAAYRAVQAALRLPRDTGIQLRERTARLDAALKGATDVPLSLAAAVLRVLGLAAAALEYVSGAVRGDLVAAAHLAEAAARGSLDNALLNAAAASDPSYHREVRDRVTRLRADLAAVVALLTSTPASPEPTA